MSENYTNLEEHLKKYPRKRIIIEATEIWPGRIMGTLTTWGDTTKDIVKVENSVKEVIDSLEKEISA